MPWVWVTLGLVLWIVAAFAVIALCVSVRKIDLRLGHHPAGADVTKQPASRAGGGVEAEQARAVGLDDAPDIVGVEKLSR
jgi:hypothetical protein